MPVGAVLLVQLERPIPVDDVDDVRRSFVTEVEAEADEFYTIPLVPLSYDKLPRNVPRSGYWYDVGITEPYYGPGYERGDIRRMTRFAEWLEGRFPGAQVWYGHEADEHNLTIFDHSMRQRLQISMPLN